MFQSSRERAREWSGARAFASPFGALLLGLAVASAGCATPWAVRSSAAVPDDEPAAVAAETSAPALPPVSSAPPLGAAQPPSSGSRLQQWAPLSRSGRQALRVQRWADAERDLGAALALTTGLRADDLRTRTSLGDLIRLAAQLRKQGHAADSRRVMARVEEGLRERGGDRTEIESYQSLYRALTRPPAAISVGRRFASLGGHHRAPATRTFDALIAQAARSFDVDPALVKAVVAAESNFDARAVSRVGAQGLMQLMPETAQRMGVTAPFEPSQNLRGGVRYLSEMLDRYGDLRRALAAYNAGPTAVDRYRGIPPYPETRAYVSRVLGYYRGYRDHFTN